MNPHAMSVAFLIALVVAAWLLLPHERKRPVPPDDEGAPE